MADILSDSTSSNSPDEEDALSVKLLLLKLPAMTAVGRRSLFTSLAAVSAADRQPRKRGRPKKGSKNVVRKRRPQLHPDSRCEL